MVCYDVGSPLIDARSIQMQAHWSRTALCQDTQVNADGGLLGHDELRLERRIERAETQHFKPKMLAAKHCED